MKSREAELRSHRLMCCLAVELFLNSCFLDTVFVILFTELLKQQLAKYTNCLALAGSPPP